MTHFAYCRFVQYYLHPNNVTTGKPIQPIFYVGSSHDTKKALWMVKNWKKCLHLLFLKMLKIWTEKSAKYIFLRNGSLTARLTAKIVIRKGVRSAFFGHPPPPRVRLILDRALRLGQARRPSAAAITDLQFQRLLCKFSNTFFFYIKTKIFSKFKDIYIVCVIVTFSWKINFNTIKI